MSNRFSYMTIILLLVGLVVGVGGGVLYTSNSAKYKIDAYENQVSNLTTELDRQTSTINSLTQENTECETLIASLEDDVYTAYDTVDYFESMYVELLADYQSLKAQQNTTEDGCEYEVVILVNQEYYHDVLDEIKNARTMIIITMYSMKYTPGDSFNWANDLIEELVKAKNRGVNVVVFLEYQTFFGVQDENLDAYDFLTANDVNVWFDYEDDTDHAKTVNIDQSIYYVGSHNWSESGLYYNNEVSVKLIRNP